MIPRTFLLKRTSTSACCSVSVFFQANQETRLIDTWRLTSIPILRLGGMTSSSPSRRAVSWASANRPAFPLSSGVFLHSPLHSFLQLFVVPSRILTLILYSIAVFISLAFTHVFLPSIPQLGFVEMSGAFRGSSMSMCCVPYIWLYSWLMMQMNYTSALYVPKNDANKVKI